jgi:hypothetical protein
VTAIPPFVPASLHPSLLQRSVSPTEIAREYVMDGYLGELYELLEQDPANIFLLERLVEGWLDKGDQGESTTHLAGPEQQLTR